MTSFFQGAAVLVPVAYLVLAALYAMEFGGPRAPRPRRLRHVLTAMVVAGHAAYLVALWVHLGHLPASDPWILPSVLAFSLMIIYLPVEWTTRTPQTGGFVVTFCFLLQLVSSTFATLDPKESELLSRPFFALHVGMSLVALSALMLSGFYGGLYLLLLRQMKRHQFGVLFRKLPDLDSLSRLNRGTAWAGFLLLTAGLNLALAWAHADPSTQVDYLDPKILMVLITWVSFGLIAASRWIRVLSGRRAAIFALAGLVLVFLTLLLSHVPLGSLTVFR